MANRISGMNSLNRLRPVESEQPKQAEKPAAEKSINQDTYDGMSGAERAEMQRFMNLKHVLSDQMTRALERFAISVLRHHS